MKINTICLLLATTVLTGCGSSNQTSTNVDQGITPGAKAGDPLSIQASADTSGLHAEDMFPSAPDPEKLTFDQAWLKKAKELESLREMSLFKLNDYVLAVEQKKQAEMFLRRNYGGTEVPIYDETLEEYRTQANEYLSGEQALTVATLFHVWDVYDPADPSTEKVFEPLLNAAGAKALQLQDLLKQGYLRWKEIRGEIVIPRLLYLIDAVKRAEYNMETVKKALDESLFALQQRDTSLRKEFYDERTKTYAEFNAAGDLSEASFKDLRILGDQIYYHMPVKIRAYFEERLQTNRYVEAFLEKARTTRAAFELTIPERVATLDAEYMESLSQEEEGKHTFTALLDTFVRASDIKADKVLITNLSMAGEEPIFSTKGVEIVSSIYKIMQDKGLYVYEEGREFNSFDLEYLGFSRPLFNTFLHAIKQTVVDTLLTDSIPHLYPLLQNYCIVVDGFKQYKIGASEYLSKIPVKITINDRGNISSVVAADRRVTSLWGGETLEMTAEEIVNLNKKLREVVQYVLANTEEFRDIFSEAQLRRIVNPSLALSVETPVSLDTGLSVKARRAGVGSVDLRSLSANGVNGQSIEVGLPVFVQLNGNVSGNKTTDKLTGSVAYRLGDSVIGAIQAYANSGKGFETESKQLETSVVMSHNLGSFFIEGQLGRVSAENVHSSTWSGLRSQLTLGLDTAYVSPFIQVSHRQLDKDAMYQLKDTVTYLGLDMDIASLTADTYTLTSRLTTKVGYGEKHWKDTEKELGSTRGMSGSVTWSASLNLNSGVSFTSNLNLDTVAGSNAAFNLSLNR